MFQKDKLISFFRTAGYVLILFSVLVIPFFMDSKSQNFFFQPKSFLFMAVVLIGLLLFGAEAGLNKGLAYTSTPFGMPYLILLLITGVSAAFSAAPLGSFIGRPDYFVLSFVLVLCFGAYAALVVQHAGASRGKQLLNAYTLVGFLTTALFLMKTVFKMDVFGARFPNVWNTLDATNTNFAVWVTIILVVSLGQLLKKELSVAVSVIYGVVSLSAFVALLVMGFGGIWWLVLIGLVLLSGTGLVLRRSVKMPVVFGIIALTALTGSFVIFGSPRKFQTAIPLEAALGSRPSWSMVSQSIVSSVRNFAVGNGAGTFNYVFSKYRDPAFNYDQNASGVRFNYPHNTFFAMLSEFGVFFSLAFVFFVVYLGANIFGVLGRSEVEESADSDPLKPTNLGLKGIDAALLGVAWFVLTAGMAFFYYNFALWWLWVLLGAIIMIFIGTVNPGLNRLRVISFTGNAERSASLTFILFAFEAALLIALFIGARWYVADHLFTGALAAEFPKAEADLIRSASLRDNDSVHSVLAQLYFKEAARVNSEPGHDQKAVDELAAKAVTELKKAVALAPQSVTLLGDLAALNRQLLCKVPEARDQAINALTTAKDLEPSNPEIYKQLGDLYAPNWLRCGDVSNDDCKLISCDWIKAAENYKATISLKKDYGDALAGLTNAYERAKQPEKALGVYTDLIQGAPKDVPSLFNYGRLLYNRNGPGDRDAAEKIWQSVLLKEPNYSNALYSLGLINELRGDKAAALQYYQKVKELNPLKPDKSNLDAVNAINAKISKLQKR